MVCYLTYDRWHPYNEKKIYRLIDRMEQIMKKQILARFLLIGAGMALSLSGCGKEKETAAETAAKEQTTKQESQVESSVEEESAEQPSPEEQNEICFTVVHNYVETQEMYIPEEGDGYPYAYVNYPTFELPDALWKNYPALAQGLEDYSTTSQEEGIRSLANAARNAQEWDMEYYYSMIVEDQNLEILRADDKAVGFLITLYYSNNGPHPVTYFTTGMMDTKTGERLTLSDVVKDVDGLAAVILDNLVAVDETYVFSEEENEQMLPLIEDMIVGEYLPWTLDETGFHAYFDAYALQYYAFGPIFADLSYDEYSELFNPDYLPVQTQIPLTQRITYEKAEPTSWSFEELAPYAEQGEGDDTGYYVIECPDWDVPYVADGIFDTLTASPIRLTELEKKTSEALFPENWSAETGIELPNTFLSGDSWYFDETYYYYADNSADYGRLALEVSKADSYDHVGTYDFSDYLNTPTPGNEYTTLYIYSAAIYDGILYTEISHRTYAEDQPCTGYIVAVEVDTGRLLWRSRMQVANGYNFVVGEDTILCGYGFTAEDDYLYILSRHSGAVLEQRKLKTGPDYFIPVDDSLYVLTYDTAYKYRVSGGWTND